MDRTKTGASRVRMAASGRELCTPSDPGGRRLFLDRYSVFRYSITARRSSSVRSSPKVWPPLPRPGCVVSYTLRRSMRGSFASGGAVSSVHLPADLLRVVVGLAGRAIAAREQLRPGLRVQHVGTASARSRCGSTGRSPRRRRAAGPGSPSSRIGLPSASQPPFSLANQTLVVVPRRTSASMPVVAASGRCRSRRAGRSCSGTSTSRRRCRGSWRSCSPKSSSPFGGQLRVDRRTGTSAARCVSRYSLDVAEVGLGLVEVGRRR